MFFTLTRSVLQSMSFFLICSLVRIVFCYSIYSWPQIMFSPAFSRRSKPCSARTLQPCSLSCYVCFFFFSCKSYCAPVFAPCCKTCPDSSLEPDSKLSLSCSHLRQPTDLFPAHGGVASPVNIHAAGMYPLNITKV